MMRTILSSLSLLLVSTFSYSQDSRFKFGIQAGLNYSDFRGYDVPAGFSPFYSESPAFAYLGGLHLEYQIKPQLSLKIEVNYERKSQKADNTVQLIEIDEPAKTYTFTSKRNHDYLVVPILMKYSFTEQDSFYVNGGPFIGLLLKSNLTNDLEEIDGMEIGTDDTTDLHKKTDLGLSIGIGKTFDLNGKNFFFIELRENLGLTNTSKYGVWGNGALRTNSLNLILGYSL